MSHTRPMYPPAFKAEAVQLARSSDKSLGAVAKDLGIADQTLRTWVRQAEADTAKRRDRLTSAEREEIAALRKENAELRRANEIKAASAYFARELDPTRPKR